MPTPWISALNTPWAFFGLTVPAVTYVMAGGTILVGAGFGLHDYIKVNRLSQQVTGLNSALKEMKKPVTQDIIESLHKIFSEVSIGSELRECWGEFRETLLAEKLENGEVVY